LSESLFKRSASSCNVDVFHRINRGVIRLRCGLLGIVVCCRSGSIPLTTASHLIQKVREYPIIFFCLFQRHLFREFFVGIVGIVGVVIHVFLLVFILGVS
jgi:hypothetical protein